MTIKRGGRSPFGSFQSPPALPGSAGDRSQLYTVKEAAARLSVSPQTVRRYIKEGTLVGYQPGAPRRFAEWRISEDAIQSFLKARSSQ